MATQFQQQVTDPITTNRKADKVKRWQELATAAALIKAEIDALKTGILEDNDQRFMIVEDTVRESAPSKADYIKLHGEAAFETNKKVTNVKRHVKGIR